MNRIHFVLPALVLLVALAAGQSDVIATRFKQLDTNGDGKLSADEVKAAPAALQQRLKGVDRDTDGKISRVEYDAFVKLLPRFRDAPDEAARFFRLLDADNDGLISPKEFERIKSLR